MNNSISQISQPIDLESLNKILNTSQSDNNYKAIKFLGNDRNTNNYLLNDVKGNHYICKTRPMKSPYKEQTEFELSLYNYLDKKRNIRKYINPSIYHLNDGKYIYCIYPVIHGVSLNKLKEYMNKLTPEEHLTIASYLIKKLLEAIGNIHKLNIAHNSIDENNIIIDISNKLNIKLTNFNMGCGRYLPKTPENLNTLNNTEANQHQYIIKNCSNGKEQLNKDHINDNHGINYAKKWDLWCIGIICLKLLLGNNAFPWNKMINSYWSNNRQLNKLNQLYLQSIYQHVKKINNRKMKHYTYYITKNLLDQQFAIQKNPAEYVLEKIIIYEKYK